MARSEAQQRRRCVLVMRFSALGDVAMTIPVLYPVCRANRDVRFVMLTKKWPASIFHDRPDNLDVLGVDFKTDYKGIPGLVKLAATLARDYHIDAVADLHNVVRSRMIGLCLGLRGIPVEHLDKQRALRKALIDHKACEPVTPTHERYRQVFERLGITAPGCFTRLYDGKQLPVSPIVPDKQPGERWIAIAPFSAHQGKVYPLEQMRQVVSLLSENSDYRIFLLGGGKKEASILQPWQQQGRVISLAAVKHGFVDEYALLSRCDLMLTMDSANMHFASLVGLKSATIWGATSPSCGFQGYGKVDDDDIQLDLPCRPCSIYGERECRYGDYRCLAGITPHQVVHHLRALLDR